MREREREQKACQEAAFAQEISSNVDPAGIFTII
jgi:hypothetical protein